jgi:putative membrane protein
MIELIAGTAAGVVLGTVSGLLPGIHVNTLAGIMLALLAILLPLFGPFFLAAVLVSALVTHCFLDAVPSTFLGIPDADTAVAVLPAHSLCLEGRGEEAVRVAALGSATGVVLSAPICLILIMLMPPIQPAVDWASGIIIIAVVTILALQSSAARLSIAVFLLSGLLGIFSFRYAFLSPSPLGGNAVLMPLLSGLFGVSVLLFSGKGSVPPQDFSGIAIGNSGIVRGTILGSIAGVFVGWLPGLSNATANGVLASAVDYSRDRREYILATSAANTTNALVGLAAFFSIERTRNGVVSALSALEVPSLPYLLLSATIAALAAYILTIVFAGMAHRLEGIDRTRLAVAVIGFVTLVAFLTTGPFGLLVLALATAIGCVPRLLGIPQVFCMGSIMLPVMLFSFGIGPL